MNEDIATLSSWLAVFTGEMIQVVVEADGAAVFTVGADHMGMEQARQMVASAAASRAPSRLQTRMLTKPPATTPGCQAANSEPLRQSV